jgi:hypothetical protein
MEQQEFLPHEVQHILRAKESVKESLIEFNMTLGKLGIGYQKSYFVSGGCIASLLQGEKPRDIDVWFLSEYHAKPVTELYTNDPSYMSEVAVYDEKYREIKGHPGSMCITENAITLRNGIQLITKHYGIPDDVRKTFDFVHCMPYYDTRDDKLFISRQQYECCIDKKLVINNTSSLTTWREDKLKLRGYNYVNVA